MRNCVTIDDSNFPIVILEYATFLPTLDEIILSQQHIVNFCEAHENFVVVVNFPEMGYVPTEYRVFQSKWLENTKPLFIKQKIRIAYHASNLGTRIMLKGLFLFGGPGVPYTITSTREEALAWSKKQIALSNAAKPKKER